MDARQGIRRDGDDHWLGLLEVPNLARRFPAVHAGHLKVHEDQVVRSRLIRRYGLDSIRDYIHFEPRSSQNYAYNLPIDRVVLNNQDLE